MSLGHIGHRHHGLVLASVFVILFLAVCAGSAAGYNVAYGETIEITPTNPFGGTAYFYIQGTNFPFSPLTDASGDQITVVGKGRTVEIKTSDIRSSRGQRPDVGSYTIYVSNNGDATSVKNLDSGNGYWAPYSLTIRPIGVTVEVAPSVVTTPSTAAPTIASTSVPTAPSTPVSTPASPAPIVAVLAGLGAAVLALRR